MKNVTVLIDNSPHPSLDLHYEHGLSIYFEVDGFKWLFDVGSSGHFIDNAIRLGIHIEEIDFLVLSHGHADHTGGLQHFLNVNRKAKIYISAHIRDTKFYSYSRQSKRNISTDFSIVEQNIHRFIFVEANRKITDNVGLVCEIQHNYITPKENRKLFLSGADGEKPDDFIHEMALAVNTTDGLVVLSGCSHNGVLNILEACSNYFPGTQIIACIGGTHLKDSDSVNINESESEICEIGNTIIADYPKMQLITGHCTGKNSSKLLAGIMGNKFKNFYSGAVFEIS